MGFTSNVCLCSALVDMYGKCGRILHAHDLFDKLGERNAVTWNSLISGYLHGWSAAVLIFKSGHASHMYGQNGLVSMYARCGILGDAKKVFSSMEERDVISWNALLSGYAHHGFGREAVELFEQMRRTDIKPDSTTFLAVLTACSHVGLVEKGLEYFSVMRSSDLLEPPKLEHYATVVNLFGQAGHLEEAEAFIYGMPVKPGPSVYKALLSSCRIHGNKEIALRSAKKLLELYPDDPATCVLLSNFLLTGCEWIDAAEVRHSCVIEEFRRNRVLVGFSSEGGVLNFLFWDLETLSRDVSTVRTFEEE